MAETSPRWRAATAPTTAQRQAIGAQLQAWGLAGLRPGQDDAIGANLAGDDALVLLPTGAGKSLCYQLPAVLLRRAGEGPTIVVSPLIALMDDQASAIAARGLRVAVLRGRAKGAAGDPAQASPGTTPSAEVRPELADVLLLSPEKAAGVATRRLLRALRPSRLVIDEAHCVSEWGHDFRPEYRQLAALRAELEVDRGPLPVLALTATAAPEVQRDIAANLGLRRPVLVRVPHRRANLALSILPCSGDRERTERIVTLLRGHPQIGATAGRAIVYGATRKRVRDLAEALRKAGVAADWYHAGRTIGAKAKALEAFAAGKRPVLCATTAFGMGVDRDDVRLVIHAQAPASLAAWLQEAGRSGRDGRDAEALMLWADGDIVTQGRLRGPRPSAGALAGWQALLDVVDGTACRWRAIAQHLDGDASLPADEAPCGRCDACREPDEVAARAAALRARRDKRGAERSAKIRSERATPVSAADLDAIVGFVAAMPRPVGKTLLAAALRGSRAKAVKGRRLDAVAGFGSLGHLPDLTLRLAIDALLTEGRLAPRGRKMPTVWLPGRPVRGGAATAVGSSATTDAGAPGGRRARSRRPGADAPKDPLRTALRSWRRATAKNRKIKPFQVFPDRTIEEIVAARPTSLAALEPIFGLGPKRIGRDGDMILELVRAQTS